MLYIKDIKENIRLSHVEVSQDGGSAVLTLPTFQGSVIFSWGGGWEHISIAPFRRKYIPSWNDMCMIKDIFFGDDEWVMQFHPPRSQYVNNMPNCLHLWRPVDGKFPTPPSILTGIRDRQTVEEIIREMNGVL